MPNKRLYYLCQNVKSFYRQADYYGYKDYFPAIEYEHAAVMYTSPKPLNISGSDVEVKDPQFTPDFRIEEPPYTRYHEYYAEEEERPYRISPHYKQTYYKWLAKDNPDQLGCACTTVYRRLHLVGACAVITSRHILTTATSTEVILKKRRHFKSLKGVLGYWYDYNGNVFNSSLYAEPARIHYHPKYIRPSQVNRSHPIPAVFDLAVWASTYRMYTTLLYGGSTVICNRGGSHWMQHGSAVPKANDLNIIVGWQFMKAYKRKPMPWFKYAVRTRKHYWPCPKVEWGWFNCIRGNWAKLGLDSGAPIFRALQGVGWLYDGLIGMNVVSMRLRSYDMIHYFQVLDSHAVLDFLYDAYMGFIPYEYLDFRFTDSQGRSPAPKDDNTVYWNYSFGEDLYIYEMPNY